MSERPGEQAGARPDGGKSSNHESSPQRGLGTSPSQISDPRARHEFARAFIWALTIGAVVLLVYISSALLALFGAMVLPR